MIACYTNQAWTISPFYSAQTQNQTYSNFIPCILLNILVIKNKLIFICVSFTCIIIFSRATLVTATIFWFLQSMGESTRCSILITMLKTDDGGAGKILKVGYCQWGAFSFFLLIYWLIASKPSFTNLNYLMNNCLLISIQNTHFFILDIHPISLLKDSLKSEETEIRLKALNRLTSVAAALGAERSRVELIPYLLGFYLK